MPDCRGNQGKAGDQCNKGHMYEGPWRDLGYNGGRRGGGVWVNERDKRSEMKEEARQRSRGEPA